MTQINTRLFQRSILRVLPNNLLADILEIIFLLLISMLAVTLHAKLRIPMGIPGKHGLLFMFLMITGKMASRFSFAATISSAGAAALLFFNLLGFSDPFMPAIYLVIGFTLDLLFAVYGKRRTPALLIAFFCGVSYLMIPLLRSLLSAYVHIPYHSLMSNAFMTFLLHFIFGAAGGLAGAALMNSAVKKFS